jgi:hypothetical protein
MADDDVYETASQAYADAEGTDRPPFHAAIDAVRAPLIAQIEELTEQLKAAHTRIAELTPFPLVTTRVSTS